MKLWWFLYLISSTLMNYNNCENSEPGLDASKLEKFATSIGKPNIYIDDEEQLVLLVTVYTGDAYRVLDSGLNAVAIQIKDAEQFSENERLLNYLSSILEIEKRFFTIESGSKPFQKIVKISSSTATPYSVIDKLIAALEVTAREDPGALKKAETPSTDPEDKYAPQDMDATKEFTWRNGFVPKDA